MTRFTPADNLAFFVESNLAFDQVVASTWRLRAKGPRRHQRWRFNACAFVESVLWLAFGARHRLFEPRDAHRYYRYQERLAVLLGVGRLEPVVRRLERELGWPTSDLIERLFQFIRFLPTDPEESLSVVEPVLTEYRHKAHALAADPRFLALIEHVSLDPWTWPETTTEPEAGRHIVTPSDVSRALRQDALPVHASTDDAALVAGLLQFTAFVWSVRESTQDEWVGEGRAVAYEHERIVSELIRIQFWRMNLSQPGAMERVVRLIGLTEGVAAELLGAREAEFHDAIATIWVSCRLWRRQREGSPVDSRFRTSDPSL